MSTVNVVRIEIHSPDRGTTTIFEKRAPEDRGLGSPLCSVLRSLEAEIMEPGYALEVLACAALSISESQEFPEEAAKFVQAARDWIDKPTP